MAVGSRRRALGLHPREMGQVRTVVLGDNLKTCDLDRSGLCSVPLRRHRLRLGDLCAGARETYLLRHPLAGLGKNRRSSSITLPSLAADGPFPPAAPTGAIGNVQYTSIRDRRRLIELARAHLSDLVPLLAALARQACPPAVRRRPCASTCCQPSKSNR